MFDLLSDIFSNVFSFAIIAVSQVSGCWCQDDTLLESGCYPKDGYPKPVETDSHTDTGRCTDMYVVIGKELAEFVPVLYPGNTTSIVFSAGLSYFL